jgi:hypothetical protein
VRSGDSLTFARAKAIRATKSNRTESIELTQDAEYKDIQQSYLRKMVHDKKWTK